jgi:hypothetical protein
MLPANPDTTGPTDCHAMMTLTVAMMTLTVPAPAMVAFWDHAHFTTVEPQQFGVLWRAWYQPGQRHGAPDARPTRASPPLERRVVQRARPPNSCIPEFTKPGLIRSIVICPCRSTLQGAIIQLLFSRRLVHFCRTPLGMMAGWSRVVGAHRTCDAALALVLPHVRTLQAPLGRQPLRLAGVAASLRRRGRCGRDA